MKLRGKFAVIMTALALVLASAYTANAGMGVGSDQLLAQATNSNIGSDKQDVNSHGAVRVDRDLEAVHSQDSNQFGGDEAYRSTTGHTNKEANSKAHRWNPESYGQMGSYGRDSH